MSLLPLLTADLQSISTESRRKHPEVRDAADHSLGLLRTSPDDSLASISSGGPKSEELLKPIFLACQTKNAKIVGIAIGSIQRLLASKAISQSFAPRIVSTMTDSVSQGVDIQLRILQTLLSLLTNFVDIHGDMLGDAFLVCFRLHDSRIAVVSSTAAATLRQLVMFIFEKVADEDRMAAKAGEDPPVKGNEVQLPDGTTVRLRIFADDAFGIFYDLCLLANSAKAKRLKLTSLSKTFALELIESVLTNYHELFRKHRELLVLLRQQLCPFLLKALSDKPHFPLTLRSVRVVYLFLRQFMHKLRSESETFLTLLTKSITGETEPGHAERPHWVRVLWAEVVRGLCGHADLVAAIWEYYDSQPNGSKVFGNLISAMNRLATEKPALLGSSAQMQGVGILTYAADGTTVTSGGGLDMGSMAGMVASAASATVSGVVGMMGPESGLSLAGSSMKVPCIDQLDKTDAPLIPDSYIYLLALQTLVSIGDGLSSQVVPLYSSIIARDSSHGSGKALYAPSALHLDTLEADDSDLRRLRISYAMTEAGWPGLLASLSFFMAANISDELFVDVLGSFRNLINVSGVLGLRTPRDTFLTGLSKFAVPPRVVSGYDSYVEPSIPRTPGMLSVENLGLTSLTGGTSGSVAPTLSERNVACLKVYLTTAHFLAGSMGSSWFDVFETLQNAEHVLGFKVARPGLFRNAPSAAPIDSFAMKARSPSIAQVSTGSSTLEQQSRHPILSELDRDHVRLAIRRLFEASKSLEIEAFHAFIDALCKLSADMVEMQSGGDALIESESMEDVSNLSAQPLSPRSDRMRRRASGMQLPRTVRSGDFGISKLGLVANLNIQRLISADAQDILDRLVKHLVWVLRGATTPSLFRLQATETLDDVLLALSRNIGPSSDALGPVQGRILDALAQQMSVHTMHGNASTLDIRRFGLQTLYSILQQAGHTFVLGWDTIFTMLSSVCRVDKAGPRPQMLSSVVSSRRDRPPPLQPVSMKGDSALITVAFSSLKLICSDYLPSLSVEHLRLCMSTLVNFGKQTDDLNIALTAGAGLLSNISDYVQTKRMGESTEYDALWMFLLHQLLSLCDDVRPEARNGSIQTLSRTLQLYGTTLTDAMWNECLWDIILSLLRSLQGITTTEAETPNAGRMASPSYPLPGDIGAWSETKILAWQSLGSVLSEYMFSTLVTLPTFLDAWQVFLDCVKSAFLEDAHAVGAASMQCLERLLKSAVNLQGSPAERSTAMLPSTWDVWKQISAAVTSPDGQSKEYTQECLLALIDTASVIYGLSGREQWSLHHSQDLLQMAEGFLLYSHSPEYRPDVDALSPLQAAILRAVENLDLALPGTASLVLVELSKYTRMAFYRSADDARVIKSPKSAVSSRSSAFNRVTYVALAKRTMPLIVDRFLSCSKDKALYVDGTVEALVKAYSLPIRLKYRCPPSSKIGTEAPLWKTATTSFVQVLPVAVDGLKANSEAIPQARVSGLWTQVLDAFEGALTADCSFAQHLTLREQEEEENFDRVLLNTLETHVLPCLGDSRVPAELAQRLSGMLVVSSRLHKPAPEEPVLLETEDATSHVTIGDSVARHGQDSSEGDIPDIDTDEDIYGSTVPVIGLSRERFRYWCFDLLFLVCSRSRTDHEPERRRLACLSLPCLLTRCRLVLSRYIADDELRGDIPFVRIREEELLHVLRRLSCIRLWPGSLWAAFSNDPSANAVAEPALDRSLAPMDLMRESMQRSTRAHLFHFYPLLCDIVSIPRPPPTAWIIPDSPITESPRASADAVDAERPVQVDARRLARECLAEIGKALGV